MLWRRTSRNTGPAATRSAAGGRADRPLSWSSSRRRNCAPRPEPATARSTACRAGHGRSENAMTAGRARGNPDTAPGRSAAPAPAATSTAPRCPRRAQPAGTCGHLRAPTGACASWSPAAPTAGTSAGHAAALTPPTPAAGSAVTIGCCRRRLTQAAKAVWRDVAGWQLDVESGRLVC